MKNIKNLAIGLASMFLLVGCGHSHTHAFESYQKDETQHWQVCECGEETEHLDHEYEEKVTKEAGCETAGEKTFTCICGASFTREIEAIGHSWDEGKVTTAPGASTEGVKTFTCGNCGATKTESISPLCAIEEDTSVVLEGYSKIYRIDIQSETLGFSTELEISDMALKVKVAYKIVDGGEGVFYQPVLGGTEFQWTTNEENTGGWANAYDLWYEGQGALTETGKLTVTLNHYEQRQFAAGAKVYIAVELIKYSVTTTTEVTYGEGYTVHEIKVLKDCGTFQVALPVGEANTDVTAAVQVAAGTTWVGFIGGNIAAPIYFRPAWNNDWWEPYNRFKEFTGTSDANGNLVVEIQKYDADLTAGTIVHVATKVAPKVKFTVGETTDKTLAGYSKVYAITVTSPTNTFETPVTVGAAGEIVDYSVTVECPSNIYVLVHANDVELKWWNSAIDWCNDFGQWHAGQTTLDENGAIKIKVTDYGTEFPTGTVIYVAVEGDGNTGVISTQGTNETLEGYNEYYSLKIVREEVKTFTRDIKIGAASREVVGKLKIESPADVYYEPFINGTSLNFVKGNDSWSTAFGTWLDFTATANENGTIAVQIKDFQGTAFGKGAVVTIAIKDKPTSAFTIYDSKETVSGFDKVQVIETNFQTDSFETKLTVAEGEKEIVGKLRVNSTVNQYMQVLVNGADQNWFNSAIDWCRKYGEWYDFTAQSDANGQITININDFQGGKVPAGVTFTFATKVKGDEIVKVYETTDVTYEDGYTVYAIEVIQTNNGTFDVMLPVAEANTKVVGAMTCGGTYDDFLCAFTNGFDDYKFWHATISYGGGWSYLNGEWREFEQTTDADGCIKVSSKRYTKDVTPGAIIYVAVKTAA